MALSDIAREVRKWRSLVWGILDPENAASGEVLTADGSGSASYQPASGGGGGGVIGTEYVGTGNGSQTIFTAADLSPAGFNYTSVAVYLDGVYQTEGNYVTTDSTTITFNTAPASGVEVIFIADGDPMTIARVSNEYCPGYSSYSQISGTEFTVDLVNAVNLFYPGRRVKFVGPGGTTDFGEVVSRDFDSTQANDTYVSMTMDGGDSIPATINNVCLVSSDTQWSPIAGDPFSGNPINDICTGEISGTQWWFAVGDGGRIATSDDGGATWTLRTTVATDDLYCCTYDITNETFWAGGQNGTLMSTTDGVNITEDTTSIPALTAGGDGRIRGMAYTVSTFDGVQIIFLRSGQYASAYTITQGASWVVPDTSVSIPEGNHCLKAEFDNTDPGLGTFQIRISNTQSRFYTNITAGDGTGDSLAGGNTPSAQAHFFDGSANTRVYGITNGDIIGFQNWTGDDTVTFVNQHNDGAYSPLHDRLVMVGNNGQIGYWDGADQAVNDAWVSVANGFDPLANIIAVDWNETDGVFVAVADNGEICRSSNGTN